MEKYFYREVKPLADMDLTPEEIEQAVRRGCRGLPEAVVELCVAEALREWERMIEDEGQDKRNRS